jgi:hypothetical protein
MTESSLPRESVPRCVGTGEEIFLLPKGTDESQTKALSAQSALIRGPIPSGARRRRI